MANQRLIKKYDHRRFYLAVSEKEKQLTVFIYIRFYA
jgi:hypothetical protein